MTEPVVVGRDVWKVYGSKDTEITALGGIDVDVQRGEMLAIMGPSGCGKTTFLNCFSGLDEINRGRITLEGVDLHSMNDRVKSDYRARRVGFVFQSYNLLPVLSATENVEMPLLIAGVGGREARDRVSYDVDGTRPGGPAGPSTFGAFGGSSSGSPWHGHWSGSQQSCGPTNRPATSTRGIPAA